jgi:hypothetical protein
MCASVIVLEMSGARASMLVLALKVVAARQGFAHMEVSVASRRVASDLSAARGPSAAWVAYQASAVRAFVIVLGTL